VPIPLQKPDERPINTQREQPGSFRSSNQSESKHTLRSATGEYIDIINLLAMGADLEL